MRIQAPSRHHRGGATGEHGPLRRSGDSASRLAARVAAAARLGGAARTLLLDLDGTLAPLASTPDAAVVPPRTLQALGEVIRKGWSVAIVSGRPAAQVRAMIPLRGIVVFGSHGLEGRWPGQPSSRVARGAALRLDALARAARLLERRPGVLVERKPAGLAIHDRNVPSSQLKSWRRERDRWLRERQLNGLERIAGKRVLELRPRGVHKGRVAETLPVEAGAPRPDASLVGMGDDRTDEDLFRAVRGKGLGVLVGRPRRTTLAEERLPSPLAVQRFLIRLAELS